VKVGNEMLLSLRLSGSEFQVVGLGPPCRSNVFYYLIQKLLTGHTDRRAHIRPIALPRAVSGLQ